MRSGSNHDIAGDRAEFADARVLVSDYGAESYEGVAAQDAAFAELAVVFGIPVVLGAKGFSFLFAVEIQQESQKICFEFIHV